MKHLHSCATRRSWVSTLALLALVLAQTLALVHGVVHVPGQARPAATALADGGKTVSSVDHLLGHTQGDQQGLGCQLYDQIAQPGGLLTSDLAVAALDLPAALVLPPAAEVISRPRYASHARGPPLA